MQFIADQHEYRDGADSVRSVTQILTLAGYIDARWYTEESRDRGSAVHTLCERYALGERFDGLGRELASLEYVNAFAAWMDDTGAYAIATECIIDGIVNGHRYAGKYDLLAEVKGKRLLTDIKTGAKAKWHHIQIAAYALAANPDKCSVLYLKPDGKYREDKLTPQEILWGIDKFKEAIHG